MIKSLRSYATLKMLLASLLSPAKEANVLFNSYEAAKQ